MGPEEQIEWRDRLGGAAPLRPVEPITRLSSPPAPVVFEISAVDEEPQTEPPMDSMTEPHAAAGEKSGRKRRRRGGRRRKRKDGDAAAVSEPTILLGPEESIGEGAAETAEPTAESAAVDGAGTEARTRPRRRRRGGRRRGRRGASGDPEDGAATSADGDAAVREAEPARLPATES